MVLPPGDWANEKLLSIQEIKEMRQRKKERKEDAERLQKEGKSNS